MTNEQYTALLRAKLVSGALTDRAILEGADALKSQGEQGHSLEGKTPRELLQLAAAIRQMVLAYNAEQIMLPAHGPRLVDRDTYMAETWGRDADDPQEDVRLEAEARRQAQQPPKKG
jgi:hypothetical protein